MAPAPLPVTQPGAAPPAPARAVFWIMLLLPWLALLDQLRLYWTIDPSYNYGWVVPFLAVYLFVKQWSSRPTAAPDGRASWLIVAAAACFAPVRLVQEATPDWSVVSWTLALLTVLFTLAVLARCGGKGWARHFAFPVCFILVAVPWPNRFEQAVMNGLMQRVAGVTTEALNWFGIMAWQKGNLIELQNGVIGIDEACSGVRSLQAMLMVSLFLGELYRLPLRARAGCVAAGLCLALVFNCIRTFSLSMIAAHNGISAIAYWHDPAGFAILVASLIALWIVINFFLRGKFAPPPAPSAGAGHGAPPLYFTAGLALWFAAAALGTELWYRAHEKGGPAAAAWSLRWPESKALFKYIPVPENTRKVLLANEGNSAEWREGDGASWAMFSFRWYPGRTSTQSARMHRPDTCLQANGAIMVADRGVRPTRVAGVDFPFHAYLFKRNGELVYVFFCIIEERNADVRERALSQDWSGSSRLQRVLAGERNLGQQSLEFAASGYPGQDAADAAFRKVLDEVIEAKKPATN